MDFRRIHVEAFGALRDLDTGPEPLTRIVAVLGPNEAGKSTLFAFLTSMLYGIYPASRDRNPYTPWNGGDLEGRAELRTTDGDVLEIHRRLLSSPSGTLTRGPATEDLRNHTLPSAEHVPREVFRQVFALTLSELATLEGESWDRVQDRLVTGMGAPDLAPIRAVADELEREAGRLWRPTRMGNQKVRDLRERVRDLRLERRAAADADRKLREAARNREDRAGELRKIRREREACHLYVERCQTLLPLRDRLRRLDELQAAAGPLEGLEGLPRDPGGRLAELDREVERLRNRRRALEAEAVASEADRAAFGEADRTVVERASEVRDTSGRAAALEPLRVRAGRLRQEVRDLERRADASARELLAVPRTDLDPAVVLGVPAGRLRRAVETYQQAHEDRRLAEEARAGVRTPDPPWPPVLGPALAVGGLLVLMVGLTAGWATVGMGAALVAGVGGALTAVDRWTRRASGPSDAAAGSERLRTTRAEDDRALAGVRSLLAGAPVRGAILERPPPQLGAEFQRLQDLLGDLADREEQLQEIRGQVERTTRDLSGLAEELAVEPGSDAGVTAQRLGVRLDEARAAREAARAADRELERIGRERESIAGEERDVRDRRDGLRERLAAAVPGREGAAAAEAVEEGLAALTAARRLKKELEREHPDLEELRRRIRRLEQAGDGWTLDADKLAERKARATELADRVEALARTLEGLEKDMEYLGREKSVGEVEGELEAVRAEMDDAIRSRDRLRVLSALLREADRRFREEHQPDILLRAGRHLAAITAGRYEKLLLDQDREGRFLLEGPGAPGPVAVDEPISRGTREQVYMALRMAILDHLDSGGERLPLFMDEAFVNWDRDRRERAFGLLDEIAATRQVFVFTCHDDVAGSLAARGARVLELDATG